MFDSIQETFTKGESTSYVLDPCLVYYGLQDGNAIFKCDLPPLNTFPKQQGAVRTSLNINYLKPANHGIIILKSINEDVLKVRLLKCS